MALSKVITKKSVKQVMPKCYSITFNLIVEDTEGSGINQDFSVEYNTGENVATKTAQVIANMQLVIDAYKAEQALYKAVGLDTAVTTINAGVIL